MTYVLRLQGSASALPLPDASVQCVITSPPYWGLRSYGGEQSLVWGGAREHVHEWTPLGLRTGGAQSQGQTSARAGRSNVEAQRTARLTLGEACECGAWYGPLGLEPSPELYADHLAQAFREVWRVLRPDGVAWLNLGDTYITGTGMSGEPGAEVWKAGYRGTHHVEDAGIQAGRVAGMGAMVQPNRLPVPGYKSKELAGVPWLCAFRLRADGWRIRSEIVWDKPNPMPESVSDRPTRAHEQLFMLVKAERYYYDRIAVLEPLQSGPSDLRKIAEQRDRIGGKTLTDTEARHKANASTNIGQKRAVGSLEGRNRRSVWRIATEPYSGAHFAAFPRKLVEPCLLSSTSPHVCKACRSALKSGATGASRFRPRSSLV